MEANTDTPLERVQALAAETLTGDLRDAILDQVKTMQKPWAQTSESEQRSIIYAVERRAAELVRQAVKIIAARGFPIVQVGIESVTIKGGLKVVCKCPKTELTLQEVAAAEGSTAILVIADMEDFTGERAPAEAQPDQPALPGTDEKPKKRGRKKAGEAGGDAPAAEEDKPVADNCPATAA